MVECPQGSRVKLKYSPDLNAFVVSRPLVLGITYPYDWGFVPSTRASDGDPVDAMVVFDAPTYPGVVISCRPVAVLAIEQNAKTGGRERNDRILVVPVAAKRSAGSLSSRLRDELAAVLRLGDAVGGQGRPRARLGRRVGSRGAHRACEPPDVTDAGTDEKPFRLHARESLEAAVQRIAPHEIEQILSRRGGTPTSSRQSSTGSRGRHARLSPSSTLSRRTGGLFQLPVDRGHASASPPSAGGPDPRTSELRLSL